MAELRIDLERWTAEETCEFVQQTLAQAGHAGQLFEPPAVKRLHELAGGRPRRVGQIADLALVAAAGQQRASIDAATIETVFRELTATGR
jgi:type II secretory pathway predicted ATPase ExeA